MINIIILGDGMSDMPYDENNVVVDTPLMQANKPNIDALAKLGEVGLVQTVPHGMSPGSDVANLSVMGYDPKKYYTGRSPLEAISIGVNMSESDLVLRCNLVTLGEGGTIMSDYSADEVTTEEASILINDFAEFLKGDERFSSLTFYAGVSYRHCVVVRDGEAGTKYTPPHDITDKPALEYYPKGVYGKLFAELTRVSYDYLGDHEVNKARLLRGLKPANAVWLWGEGRTPKLDALTQLWGKSGAVISAVDLIKGIGIAAGMKVYLVEGATGNIHTNFKGKAEAVIQAVKDGCDFVYLHIEAADEAGHQGNRAIKTLAIEKIDWVLSFIKEQLDNQIKKHYRLLVLPDHATPLALKTHTSDPVPYILYDNKTNLSNGIQKYTEDAAAKGVFVESGVELFKKFLAK